MGQSRLKKERFFEAHRFCCFCGGSTPATTIDHVPNRACFPGRAPPEGFEFPACEACNRSTRLDEIAFATMVHLANLNEENSDLVQFGKLISGLENNLPHLTTFAEMTMREKRAAIREEGFVRLPGMTLAETLMVKIPEGFGEHIDRYLRKLVKAVFYKHVGRPAPGEWVTWAEWSHGQMNANRVATEAWERMTPTIIQGVRSNIDFGDRFRYRINYSDEMPALATVGQFGSGLIFYGACVGPEIAERLHSSAFSDGIEH